MKLNNWLFKQVDNSALIVFRIFFGVLITLEAWGAILTGWIDRTLLEGEFTFNFIGFDFLQPLPGNGMYFYYGLMGLCGVCVALGYRYRIAMFSYGLMWAGVYLMQKSSYNNHYYLLMLLCGIMTLLPANHYASLDAKRNPSIKRIAMPNWVYIIIIAQLWIVYTYASIAKLYPDWLDASVPARLMRARADYPLVGDLLQESWVHYAIAYVGILFDGLIIPALLWKPTRKWAFFISIFFHLFNSIVFQIGIFPYLSLAFTLFFFEPKTIHKLFIRRKPYYDAQEVHVPSYSKVGITLFALYFATQIALPLRHWFITDDVLWTEEGHRLSWRMMLRSKSGNITFIGEDKQTGERFAIDHEAMLSRKQKRAIATKPDMIWQMAQRLRKKYEAEGREVAIYANSQIQVNGRKYKKLVNDTIDLGQEPWDHFGHHDWLLPSEDYLTDPSLKRNN
ncbi:HTTM domain-containing protein [Croceiramulus getboli]|nr:HTTM domain-containing protein [Flavobacteriaceae bacterium YJPT1-3]